MQETQFTLTIPANSVNNFYGKGKVFAVISATAAFKVRADNGALYDMNIGRGFGNPEQPIISEALFFANTSGSPITVTFYWGLQRYQPDPAQFSGSITTTTTQKNATTYAKGNNAATVQLIPGASQAFAGTDSANGRKQFVVVNHNKPPLDPSGTEPDMLHVLDSSNRIIGCCFPQQNWTAEVAGEIRIKNPAGAVNDVYYSVGEIYYT